MREYMKIVENVGPTKLYHGTRTEDVAQIMIDGLRPDRSQSSLNAVFLADSHGVADNYRFMHDVDDWTVLEIDMSQLDPAELGPDNYELVDALAHLGDERDWRDCSWQESLEICNQVAYHGIIPPSAICAV